MKKFLTTLILAMVMLTSKAYATDLALHFKVLSFPTSDDPIVSVEITIDNTSMANEGPYDSPGSSLEFRPPLPASAKFIDPAGVIASRTTYAGATTLRINPIAKGTKKSFLLELSVDCSRLSAYQDYAYSLYAYLVGDTTDPVAINNDAHEEVKCIGDIPPAAKSSFGQAAGILMLLGED